MSSDRNPPDEPIWPAVAMVGGFLLTIVIACGLMIIFARG